MNTSFGDKTGDPEINRRRVTRTLMLAAALLVGASVAAFYNWMGSRPAWCLSARNSPDGVFVEVFKQNQIQPTYSTLLKGRTIPRDVDRLAWQQLPADVGTTTFADETLRPGRWILVLGGVKLDIMERAMILDDGFTLRPSELP
jgi:hypothetical protein